MKKSILAFKAPASPQEGAAAASDEDSLGGGDFPTRTKDKKRPRTTRPKASDDNDEYSDKSGVEGLLLLHEHAYGAQDAEGAAGLPSSKTSSALKDKDIGKKRARIRYTTAQRTQALDILSRFDDKASALEEIRAIPGMEKVDRSHLSRWTQSQTAQKPIGRPVNIEFEAEVLVLINETITSAATGNLAFPVESRKQSNRCSYTCVRQCAEQVKARDPWANNGTTKKLEFSNKWINGFFRRHNMRNGDEKTKPNRLRPRAAGGAGAEEESSQDEDDDDDDSTSN